METTRLRPSDPDREERPVNPSHDSGESMSQLDARRIDRTYYLITAVQTLAIMLSLAVLILHMLDRGVSLTLIGAAIAARGLIVVLLEVPSGALADTIEADEPPQPGAHPDQLRRPAVPRRTRWRDGPLPAVRNLRRHPSGRRRRAQWRTRRLVRRQPQARRSRDQDRQRPRQGRRRDRNQQRSRRHARPCVHGRPPP